jgi:peroxiredoxin-like protein
MHPFPHRYEVAASASRAGSVKLHSDGLPDLQSAPPKEFDGPGDQWSPETLLLASVADCFVLSFRAVAAASKFEWLALACSTRGTLDRVDRISRFTEIVHSVVLDVPAGASEVRARSLLEKAEQVCLISNSLSAEVHLEAEIRTAS